MALMERKAPGVWETFQPYCAPLGLILYGAGESAEENLVSLMRSLPGYALQAGCFAAGSGLLRGFRGDRLRLD